MPESNWKTWVLVTLVMIGFSFQLLKRLPGRPSAVWDRENLRFTTGTPYSVSTSGVRPSRPRPTHIAADQRVLREALAKYEASNKPAQGGFKDKNKKDAAKAKDKSKDKDKKKKKDDAKKDDKQKTDTEAAPQIPNLQQAPPSDQSGDIGAAAAAAAKTGQLPPNFDPAGEAGFGTLEDWEHRLLGHPSLAETQTFIKDYQDHLVSSAIFYKVTGMMIDDSRPEMKELGIMCAGLTPSVQSFEMLTAAEKSSGPSSAPGKNAAQYLSKYDSMSDLSMLQNILSAADPYSETVALQMVDQLARTAGASAGQTPNPSAQGGNANGFKPLIPILTKMENGQNSTLAQQAQQTLSDILALTGGAAPAGGIASAQ